MIKRALNKFYNEVKRKYNDFKIYQLKKRDKPFIFNSKYGFKILINPSRDVDTYFYINNFEKYTMEFFSNIITNNDIILDIGANIGIYSLLSASQIKNNISIYSFEPSDEIYNELIKNIELNGFQNIKCFNTAIGDYEGRIKLKMCKDHAYNTIEEISMRPIIEVVEKSITTISNFCNQNNIDHIDILKIDVEGAEYRVIKGAELYLIQRRAPIILCEYNRIVHNNNMEILTNLENSLIEYGYVIYYLNKKRLKRFNAGNNKNINDIICLNKSHLERILNSGFKIEE